MNRPRLSINRYEFNPASLVYEKQDLNWTKIVKGVLFSMAFISLLSFVFVRLFISAIETPKELILIDQNHVLKAKYTEIQYQLDSLAQRLNVLNSTDDSVYRAILGEKPIPLPIRMGGIGGKVMNGLKERSNDLQLISETSQKIQELNNQLKISEKSYKSLLKMAVAKKEKLKHIPAIMPIHNKDLKRTGSGFGRRYHPILGIWRMHEGLDFNAPKGTEVHATGNGSVKKTYKSKTFGNCVIIDHGYGYETFYAHLQRFNVKPRQKINRGDVIGYMGSTGLSSGVHLHYEVHLNGKELNPVNYFYNDLGPDQYQEIIDIANSFTNSMD